MDKIKALAKHSTFLPWFMCFLAALFYCYEFFLRVEPSVMSDTLIRIYRINTTQFGVLSAFYYYAYTPMQLIVGPLIDLHGTRRLLTFSTLLCALGTYLFIATSCLWVANIGRFITGFGSAFAFVGVLKLAADWLDSKYFALVSGIATTLGMLGAISGEVVLTKLIKHIGWKDAIYCSVAAGVVLAIAIWAFIRDHEKTAKLHFNEKEVKRLINSLITVAKHKQVWVSGIIGGLIFMPTSVFAVIWGIPYLHTVLHVPPEEAADMTTMIFLGWAIGGPIMGWLSDKFSSRHVPLMFGTLISACLLSALFYLPHPPHAYVYWILLAFGIASSPQVLVFAISCENSPHELAGTAVAFTNMLAMLGGALIPPILGMLLDYNWDGQMLNDIPVHSEFAYKIAFSLMPIGLFISWLLSVFALKETHCKQLV